MDLASRPGVDHGAGELTDQQRERIGCLFTTDFVRTEFRQSALRFGRRKADRDWRRGTNTFGVRSERQPGQAAPSDVATASCGGETARATRT
jgi:hypothetical protein